MQYFTLSEYFMCNYTAEINCIKFKMLQGGQIKKKHY